MTRRRFLTSLAAAYVIASLPVATTPSTSSELLSAGRRYQHNCTRWVRREHRP